MARVAEALPKDRSAGRDMTRLIARQRGQAPVEKPEQPFKIIQQTFSQQMPSANAEKFAYAVTVMAKKGMVKPLQIGNTVFLLFPKGQGVYEFHTASIEPADKQVARFQALVKAAKNLGATKLISYFEDPIFNRLAKLTGLPWRITMSQRVTKAGAQPSYRAEIDI